MSTSWVEHKTITECLRAYEEQELGLVSDIAKHGCSGGVAGIIYYDETSAFHTRHENEIWDMLAEHADQHGLKKGEFLQHLSKDPGSIKPGCSRPPRQAGARLRGTSAPPAD